MSTRRESGCLMYQIAYIGRWETLPETAAAICDHDTPKLEALHYFRIRSEKVKVEESITVYKDAAERFGDE